MELNNRLNDIDNPNLTRYKIKVGIHLETHNIHIFCLHVHVRFFLLHPHLSPLKPDSNNFLNYLFTFMHLQSDFMWSRYQDKGYVTAFAEDVPWLGMFTVLGEPGRLFHYQEFGLQLPSSFK